MKRLILLSVFVIVASKAVAYAVVPQSPCREGFDVFDWPKAASEFTLIDSLRNVGFDEVLMRVLQGKEVTEDELKVSPRWHVHTLWTLLNAVYARHGRIFKNDLLNQFFYSSWCKVGPSCLLLPMRKSKDYKDLVLTKIDKENIVRLRTQLKIQCGY